LPFVRQKIGIIDKKFRRRLKKKSKKLANDPIFYFGLISVILLSGIFLFFPGSAIKSLSAWDFSFFTSDKFSSQDQNLFAEPIKNTLKETPDIACVQQNSVIAIAPPTTISAQVLGTLIGNEDVNSQDRKSIVEYTVESGDKISSLAEKFNVSADTILWANDLSKSSLIKTGQALIIPPVSGVLYHVKKGDTVSDIATIYKGDADKIIAFNELSNENDIYIGDILIIPDGKMPVQQKPVNLAVPQIPIALSYFICPHSFCRVTQRLHWYNAIDFGGTCGDSIYAVAVGVVQRVKFGWNSGAGNYIAIMHPNGVVTTYGHLQTSLVIPGQQVSQGQIVALMGGKPGTPGSGLSTGCHVHFGVSGAKNPFAK